MFENLVIPADLRPSDPRFGVGPSLIPSDFIKNLLASGPEILGTSHRKMPVRNLVKEMQDGLRSYFNLPRDYEVVLGNGGATLVSDMIGLGLVEKSSYHYVCGEFSDKWFKAHKNIPWINATAEKVEYGKGIDVQDKDGFDLIACTLNETSTGVMLTDLPKLGADKILAIDATSGAGQIPIDFSKSDFYYFSPQKVFASEGGLYVAIMSPKAIARAEKIQNSGRFIPESFKWMHAIENSKQNQTYNTPAITSIFYLNEQVKLLNSFGEKKVVELARAKADMMYDWATRKPYLECFIEEKYRSISVATINVDEKYNVEKLAAELRRQKVAYDIEGYRKLGKNQFRIGLFHNITFENLEKLTKIIDLAIEGKSL